MHFLHFLSHDGKQEFHHVAVFCNVAFKVSFVFFSMFAYAGQQKFLLVGKYLVERALRYGEAMGNVVHRDVFDALGMKGLTRGFYDV